MLTLQMQFEKWAHEQGFSLEKHAAGTYQNQKTVAAFCGFIAGTKVTPNAAAQPQAKAA